MLSLKKYDPHKVESIVREYWQKNNIYLKVKEKNRNRKKFYFLDGPPYPSSNVIHVGTGWNKVIKDTVLRFRRMCGYNVWDQPGYDCHGLPIEVAVEKSLNFKSKKDIENYGVARFVQKCRELALNNIKAMTQQFEDLGVFMDWKNPYLTMRNEYIE
ncbi:MAG: isoleucine--tRNA ligase, partial [Thermoprotei archaeon]